MYDGAPRIHRGQGSKVNGFQLKNILIHFGEKSSETEKVTNLESIKGTKRKSKTFKQRTKLDDMDVNVVDAALAE